MKRRDFIKVSGAAAAGVALAGCSVPQEAKKGPLGKEWQQFPERIGRDVEAFDPLNIKEITLEIGLEKPFDVLHVSDTHIARADNRDDERKIKLAASRSRWMNAGEHYLDEAIRIARENGMYLMHTGDMHDFVSEANLDCDAKHMMEGDWFVCAGNHEYSKYVGEAREDEAYKADSYEAVRDAFPNDLSFASRVIGGVNFVAVDDVYYNFTDRQLELMKAEVAKGLPIILLIHVPLYTPEYYKDEMERMEGRCAYLTGVPLELTETYEPGVTYPAGEEWRYRKVQQRSDEPTLRFIAWLKEQPLLKGILCGHMHRFFEDRFSSTAIQYTVGATYNGDAQVVHFK
ncbi:MAG: metallophosphoesterase [Bacteroidales bacterium]|nr:metallophosphoesterase [Bacteroidales bacterium]